MGRITASIDDGLKSRLEEQAEREGISKSELVGRGVEYYLKENSLEARVSDLEEKVEEVEKRQDRGIISSVSETFGRDRSR